MELVNCFMIATDEGHMVAVIMKFWEFVLSFFMQVIAKVLGGLSIESGSDLQKVLRVDTFTSHASALQKLEAMLPIFRSRMGALLFLISALLSRGLVCYCAFIDLSFIKENKGFSDSCLPKWTKFSNKLSHALFYMH